MSANSQTRSWTGDSQPCLDRPLTKQEKLDLLNLQTEKAKRETKKGALEDVNRFIESCLKDESGLLMRQAEIHRQWHAHIDYCQQVGKMPIIVAPWGHGKTQQLVIGRILWELGRNRNQRIGIVCNSDTNSVRRVAAIANYIEVDSHYRELFPHVRPDKPRGWGKQQFYVQRDRDARSVDPSVFAAGIFSTGIGGRMDGLVIDDPVDQRNALQQPKLRQAVIDAITNVWMSRLEPTGWMVYVATVWHPDDATHHFVRDREVRDGFCALVQRVDDEFSGIECYLVGGDSGVAYPVVGRSVDWLSVEGAEG